MFTHLFPTDEIPLPGGFFQKTSAVATKITFPLRSFLFSLMKLVSESLEPPKGSHPTLLGNGKG